MMPLHRPPFFAPVGFGEVPVGAVIPFAGSLDRQDHGTSPIEAWGWMFCDGRVLAIAQYPELFAALGFVYGGSGREFKIPDYRGYFLRGAAAGSSVDPDADQRQPPEGGQGEAQGVGSIQSFALQTHEHIYSSAPAPATPSNTGQAAGAPSATATLTTGGPTSSLQPPGTVKVSASETRPVNVYVNYLIKFTYGLQRLHR
ncbi:tail fiber protein [Mitsuaria sp. WAJ17]|uniref:phage tail protein n=1 Tax=Mitsuaria sp. WAJ17 TaxID=2761452 RepID=UPI0016013D61|nr:tail fiber protein [Mitsuaria sp. WAJ17]MBB2484563.1 tail fiber protein [Mitsuaria sp. WAJ17]